jgi:hypothetical protein
MASLMVLGLWSMQYGDRNNLNDMPFAKVQAMTADEAKARAMAKQGNIDFFVGTPVQGKSVTLTGELTDANCYLSQDQHAYDHAFCAKYCMAAGSPPIFISDQGGKVYLVLPPTDGAPVSHDALDRIGIPGIVVKGRLLNSHGVDALAVESVEH